jgi:hypothetical protein
LSRPPPGAARRGSGSRDIADHWENGSVRKKGWSQTRRTPICEPQLLRDKRGKSSAREGSRAGGRCTLAGSSGKNWRRARDRAGGGRGRETERAREMNANRDLRASARAPRLRAKGKI